MDEDSRRLILSLADRLYICSRLLTAAAERLEWDSVTVQRLMTALNESIGDATSDID